MHEAVQTHAENQRPTSVRVLIVAPGPVGDGRIGGIATFIRNFVQWAPAEFDVEIVGCSVGDEMDVGQWQHISLGDRRVPFLPVTRLPSARRSGKIPAKARIFTGIIRHRDKIATVDRVLQVHTPAIELALAGRSAPLIRVVHNSPRELVSGEESAWRHFAPALFALERQTFRRAARVYFVNAATRDSYVASIGDQLARKAHVLPNSVDSSLFHPLHGAERASVRARYATDLSLPSGERWLLSAGRLEPQKDPELLLRAFSLYVTGQGRARPAPTRLIVVGDGRLRPRMQSLAQDLGLADRIVMTGPWPQTRLAELMSVSDAFVLTSAFEAGPFVVLEALASGLPVVSTPVGAVGTMVVQGLTGWVAPARSPAELARGIQWALDRPPGHVARHTASLLSAYDVRNVLDPFYGAHRRLRSSDATAGLRVADQGVTPSTVSESDVD